MPNLRIKDQYTNLTVTDGNIETTTDTPTANFKVGDSLSQIGVKDGKLCVDTGGTLDFNAGIRDKFQIGITSDGKVIDPDAFFAKLKPYVNATGITTELISGGLNLLSSDLGTLTFARNSADRYNPYDDTFLAVNTPATRPININGTTYSGNSGMRFVEGESTNYVRNSTDLNGGTWTTGANTTVTDLGNDEFQLDFSGGGFGGRLMWDASTLSGTDLANCVQSKDVTGTVTLYIQENFGSFSLLFSTVLTDTTEWTEYQTIGSALTNGNSYRWAIQGANGASIKVRRPQQEHSDLCTSYIKTSGSTATRLVDSNIVSSFNLGMTTSGTFFTAGIPIAALNTLPNKTPYQASDASDLRGYNNGSGNFNFRRGDSSGNNQTAGAGTLASSSSLFTAAHVWDGSITTNKVILDGNGEEQSVTTTQSTFDSLSGTSVGVGVSTSSGAPWYGWIFVLVFDKALSDAEILTLHNSVSVPS